MSEERTNRADSLIEKKAGLKEKIVTRVVVGILRPFNRHKMVNLDHVHTDTDNPIVFLGNHAEIYGPIASALCFPVPVRFWVIYKMMGRRQDVKQYLYENTFSKKTFLPVFVRKLLAWLMGWLSVNVMCGLNSIPVYRDSPMKLRTTLRKSVEAMENGDNLMIFPEHPDGKYEKGGVSEFSPGFVMLAEAWWKKTGKKMRIMPVYANREERTFTFGDEIVYAPENGYASEQKRILKESRDQILRMAGIEPDEEE
ncbi:lysophospholipid acyltransferase family protein [Aristaeella lactis]|uniref:Acyltransferase n=1 Tax=Aristaeella lactis TaxID=3046383 RepID=A0AC61PI91_9FIRM|nr:1-acyl-sn-glycerol-3-phosphate acyltransferase [Aristaeella lactis]QUA53669.1 1-acyl-sn-glycerol-3-phosphate acyltransferase [Aristaeella lactis]SMC38268.1 Acyltransferase [Aristaeella lactis]